MMQGPRRNGCVCSNSMGGLGRALPSANATGDLLGQQQSGHIKLVGPELYRHLFERAVRTARGEVVPSDFIVELHVDTSGSIPLDYVADDVIRLEIHARIAKARSEDDLDQLEDELEDRFGSPPPGVRTLIALARIRLKCAAPSEFHALTRVRKGSHLASIHLRPVIEDGA
jgi:transcription-repair coupling factor (superfamily II helicase)